MRLLRCLVSAGCMALLGAPAVRAEDSAGSPPAPPSNGVSAKGPHHVYLVGDLLVTEPWIEVDAQAHDKAHAYFVIQNRGGATEKLISASSDVADSIVFDTNGDAPGPGDGALVIPPRQTVTLKPDGIHVVFQGLHHDIAGDPIVPGVLMFAQAGPLHIDFTTDRRQATPDASTEPPSPATSLVK